MAGSCQIVDVWQSNMYEAFRTIRSVVRQYPYIAMDTEFPGVVAKPIGTFKSNTEFTYQMIRCNVDMLKLIQLGLSFMNDKVHFGIIFREAISARFDNLIFAEYF